MKKKYWKAISMFVLRIGLIAFSGCSNPDEKEGSSSGKQTFARQDIDNLLLNVSEVKTAKTENNKNKIIFTIEIENNNAQTKDIGSIDFLLKSDDKEYSVDADSNNFGEPIEPNKKITKNLTFIAPEKLKKVKLVYKPMEKELANWDLTVPSPSE